VGGPWTYPARGSQLCLLEGFLSASSLQARRDGNWTVHFHTPSPQPQQKRSRLRLCSPFPWQCQYARASGVRPGKTLTYLPGASRFRMHADGGCGRDAGGTELRMSSERLRTLSAGASCGEDVHPVPGWRPQAAGAERRPGNAQDMDGRRRAHGGRFGDRCAGGHGLSHQRPEHLGTRGVRGGRLGRGRASRRGSPDPEVAGGQDRAHPIDPPTVLLNASDRAGRRAARAWRWSSRRTLRAAAPRGSDNPTSAATSTPIPRQVGSPRFDLRPGRGCRVPGDRRAGVTSRCQTKCGPQDFLRPAFTTRFRPLRH
jgi:hypothetical protein